MNNDVPVVVLDRVAECNFTADQRRNFLAKVNKSGRIPDQTNPYYSGLQACWEWTGHLHYKGYGHVNMNRKVYKTHRVAFAMFFRKPPLNQVLHRCDNPKCVNPAHLFEGTNDDNMEDKKRKGRGDIKTAQAINARSGYAFTLKGESHPRSKLTSKQVSLIRKRISMGESSKAVATDLGIKVCTVHDAFRGRTWKHVL